MTAHDDPGFPGDLRRQIVDAIAFHPANRGGTPEHRDLVGGMLADAIMKVVGPLDEEQHACEERGRWLAEVDAALIRAGQDEGGGYIAYTRRIDQLAAERDAARKLAEQAGAAIARVRELHVPDGYPAPDGDEHCWACHELMPCPTLQALDESPAEGDSTVKTCDNASVGVIIRNADGHFLMFDRNTFPPGTAPAAGHVDDHGSVRDAAVAEVREELGLHVVSLKRVEGGWRGNRCRRRPGARGVGHTWVVYEAVVAGDLAPSARETKNLRWLTIDEVRALVDRTVAYAQGDVSDAEFAKQPGIEPVWVQWLADLGVVEVSGTDLARIDEVACAGGMTEIDARSGRTQEET